MRFGAAEMTGHAGDPDSAVRLYEELAEDCRHWLGDDDGLTIGCRDQIASWVRTPETRSRAHGCSGS
jgi:hypothetical protein